MVESILNHDLDLCISCLIPFVCFLLNPIPHGMCRAHNFMGGGVILTRQHLKLSEGLVMHPNNNVNHYLSKGVH